MKLTRRQLAAALSAAGMASASAQQSAAQPEDLDAAARARVKDLAAALQAVKLPMATEPAFQFKA
ncbi:MAG: hypothetical protein KGN36_05375 [Acidobacteriota bacterium]|nr:hypothetical protein [Acidobacteriota bacterium]